MALDEATFIENKATIVAEILERLKTCAENEADLLIRTHKQTGENLTAVSDKISDRINLYTYQLLDYLDRISLPQNYKDPLRQCFLTYCLPILRERFPEELLKQIPRHHKNAAVSCFLAAHMVYTKGIEWSPTVVDILPLILSTSLST